MVWASIATLLLAVLPAQGIYQAFQERNDGQLASLRYVYEHTEPSDLVMDGWKGMGVFRPHAFHYFFLHEETLVMLPPGDLENYLDALENRSLRPKLIALDKNLAALGPRFLQIVNAHYTSSDGFFYLDREHATTASGSGASH